MSKSKSGVTVARSILLVLIIAMIGTIGWYLSHIKGTSFTSGTSSTITKTVIRLKIVSDPAGLDISGSPLCDSKKLKKTTPYVCEVSKAGINTVLTAQQAVTSGGQAYTFKTWDGCTDTNPDKKICQVRVADSSEYSVKASYVLASGGIATTTSPPRQPSVTCTGGSSLDDKCVYALHVNNVPTNYDIRADQVTPFPLIMEGAPLDVTCTPVGACSEYSFTDASYHPVTSIQRTRTVNWRVGQTATITITADKNHTYVSNDGKTRTWRFKQLLQSSSSGYDYVSVQYDFVSITGN